MTQFEPYIQLRRLVVITHDGTVAFDETFHGGTNIIRGRNSAGKSTIANFIFYAFGGDFTKWTTEALNCREVFAEAELNETVLTLNRQVSEKSKQPMKIFWGSFDDASESSYDNWKQYPYSHSTTKENFSAILLHVLDFPEAETASDSKITLHQLLRLLYIDQDSPVLSLFRPERLTWA